MKILSVSAMRAMEKAAFDSGIPEFYLMERAGRNAAALIDLWREGRFRRAVFFCGGGNNAGDALVCANALALPSVILAFKSLAFLKGSAAEAAKRLRPDIPVIEDSPLDFPLEPGDLLIDALLGIGFTGESVREPIASAIDKINLSGLPIVAFDLPSGLDGDSGKAAGKAVEADVTITFGAPKRGLFEQDGPRLAGKLLIASIGVPEAVHSEVPFELFTWQDARKLWKKIPSDAHKNSRGRALIAAGSTEYPGAAALAARGALYSPCGMVRLLTVETAHFPELPAALLRRFLAPGQNGEMPEDAVEQAENFFANSDALGIGSGWGSHVLPQLLEKCLAFSGPVVLDADALNLLSRNPGLWNFRSDVVMTPHPGEAKRLAQAFGIQECADRVEFASALMEKLRCVILLKGRHTVIAAPGYAPVLNGSGGPELAGAGSGDVLTGLVTGLLASGYAPREAALLGAFLHGAAGDLGRGRTIADDLPELIARSREFLRSCPFPI